MSDEAVELRIQQGDCTFGKNWEAGEYISRKTWWTEVRGKLLPGLLHYIGRNLTHLASTILLFYTDKPDQ